MNLLFTITAYPPSTGGAQIHTHQLIKTLIKESRVQVVTFWDSNRTDWLLGTTMRAPRKSQDYRIEGVPVHQIGMSLNEKAHLVPAVFLYFPFMSYVLPRIAQQIQKSIQPFTSGIDLVHNIRVGREPLSYASLYSAHRKNIPFVFTSLHHPRWSGWLHRHYHRLYRQADAVIVLTEVERRELIRLGVEEKRIYKTGIGPVLAKSASGWNFRDRYNLHDDPMVLFLGQKYPYKGIEALVLSASKVWKKYPKTHFVFIGPRTNYSKRIFSRINDPRILEIGNVDIQEKTEALDACNILCLPSNQESFGGVFTEAWSLKKPVIGCNIPAVAEVVSEGRDGFLVTQEPEMIAERICELLGLPDLAYEMGCAGYQKVQQKYSWSSIAKLTTQVYDTVLGTNTS